MWNLMRGNMKSKSVFNISSIFSALLFLASFSSFTSAFAAETEVIKFDEDELSQETVLPKFDRPDVVKSRNVVTAKKIEFAPFLGFVTTEPIYGQSKLGFNLAYHWNEDSDVSINFAKYLGGLNSQYTDSLGGIPYYLDFNRAPRQDYAVFANYEFKAYYGKISFTKQGVMNLSTYFLGGAGMIAYEHKNYPGLDFGVGQKFYFSKTLALRFDLKFQYAQGPSPFLLGKMKTSETKPGPGDFSEKWALNNLIDIGMSFLF